MYGVFFKNGSWVPRIKSEEKGSRFDMVIWEPEIYRTKEEAEARAEEIRGVRLALMIDGECKGEAGYDVEVKEV